MEKMRGGLKYEKGELLVLNYHSTPKKFITHFQEQVKFLAAHFDIIRPDQLPDFFNGTLKTEKCGLLFTFDDGLKNNLHAVEIMNGLNIKALFFVIPGFIEAPTTEQKKFYLRNIRPVVNPRIDDKEEDFTPMSWDELRLLCANGHAVGAHTLTHTLVAADSSDENSRIEVIGSKERIEQVLSLKTVSFCSINDTLQSVGKKEKELIASNYSFHFTTLPGLNKKNTDRLFIKRRNVECYWPTGAFYYAIGRSDLGRWEEKIKMYGDL